MKINPDMIYYRRDGSPTILLSASDLGDIEDYVTERAVYALFPAQPGEREWSEDKINRHFNSHRYCWGRTVKDAIYLLVRDCREFDKDR